MNRRKMLPFLALIWIVNSSGAVAQDMCSAILANGTYDKYENYSTSKNFQLVYNALCQSSIETYQQASSSSGNLGVSIIDVIDVALGGSTNSSNFSQRKNQFCGVTYSQVANSSTVNIRVEKASKAIAQAWENCVTKATGFVAWVTLSKDFDKFTISMRNNSQQGLFQITQISHPGSEIVCDGNAQDVSPTKPMSFSLKDVDIGCTKPATKTIQISMDTTAGNLRPVDIPGTETVISDLQTEVRALQAGGVPAGTIIAWYAKSGRIPDGWAICDGSNNTPDLRGKFLQGVSDMGDVGKSGGESSYTIRADSRKASDWNWGQTPWAGGLNPAASGQGVPTVPPFITAIYLMKL